MVITITSYAVDPVGNTVDVRYQYSIDDTVLNQAIPRLSEIVLSQTVPPLNVPDWSDADLCSALDVALNQTAGTCVMAQPAP
jgi:hypothetical protein